MLSLAAGHRCSSLAVDYSVDQWRGGEVNHRSLCGSLSSGRNGRRACAEGRRRVRPRLHGGQWQAVQEGKSSTRAPPLPGPCHRRHHHPSAPATLQPPSTPARHSLVPTTTTSPLHQLPSTPPDNTTHSHSHPSYPASFRLSTWGVALSAFCSESELTPSGSCLS